MMPPLIRDIRQRRQLEAEILDVSEHEQQRIGHDLHDGLCQELAGIGFAVRALQQKAAGGATIDGAEWEPSPGCFRMPSAMPGGCPIGSIQSAPGPTDWTPRWCNLPPVRQTIPG